MKHLRVFVLAACLLASGRPAFAQADELVFYASVVDKDGAPVLDLTARDFVVREDGQAREILRVAQDTDPLQIALLVDNSADMRASLFDLRRAAAAFVDHTRDGVPIALVTLAERPTIAVGYTADRAALKKGIDGMFAFPAGNYLLDGITEISQGLARRTMWRSAIAVMTGHSHEMSYRQYRDVLQSFRRSGASLNVLNVGMAPPSADAAVVISRATSETGGRDETLMTPKGLELRARQLATELSHQYRIIYARPQRLIPPKTVEVSVRRPGLRARGMLMKTDKDRP